MNYRLLTAWTAGEDEQLRELWQAGASAGAIATALGGRTTNAVLGRVHRLGLEKRSSPVPRRPLPHPPVPVVPRRYAPLVPTRSWSALPAVADIAGRPCFRCGAARVCEHRP